MTRRGVHACPVAGLDLYEVGPKQQEFAVPSLEHGSGHICRAMCNAYALCEAYDRGGTGWMTAWVVLHSCKLGFRHIGHNVWEYPQRDLPVYNAAGVTEQHFEMAQKVVRHMQRGAYDMSPTGEIAQMVTDAVELDAWSQGRNPHWMTLFLSYSTAVLPIAKHVFEATKSFASFADIWPISRPMTAALRRAFAGCGGGMRTRPNHVLRLRG